MIEFLFLPAPCPIHQNRASNEAAVCFFENTGCILLDGEQLRSLVFLQQIGHVFQTDAQCGGIVQQRGYCGRQYPRYAQGDQRQVEGHDKPVTAVNPRHQRFTELTQRHQLKEIL